MDQLHLLILLSISMLIGSFLSGLVPMAFKLSDSKSRLLALMGSGILVGTALAIIIPEGIDSIYAKDDQQHNSNISLSNPISLPVTPQEPIQLWVIGVSLVAGFVLMLLIDQFSLYQAGMQSGDNENHHKHEYALANQDDLDQDDDDEEDNNKSNQQDNFEISSETKPIRVSIRNSNNLNNNNHSDSKRTIVNTRNRATPTLGLVIHASADGIALGAAATTSHRDVEMIIFLAIMLHKAPAAFSLVVFLIHRGLKHSTIRRHLLAFSLSAPLAALITYFGLSQSGKESLRRNNATGIAMLFSAGTFLYVATVHVLPELVHNKLLSAKELLFFIGGAFLPILLAQMI